MARASVHCCPSLPDIREAFGLVVLEAKAAGLPSVVTPSGNLRDARRSPPNRLGLSRGDRRGSRRRPWVFPVGSLTPGCGARRRHRVGGRLQRGAVCQRLGDDVRLRRRRNRYAREPPRSRGHVAGHDPGRAVRRRLAGQRIDSRPLGDLEVDADERRAVRRAVGADVPMGRSRRSACSIWASPAGRWTPFSEATGGRW